jgi:hypothetical protein
VAAEAEVIGIPVVLVVVVVVIVFPAGYLIP